MSIGKYAAASSAAATHLAESLAIDDVTVLAGDMAKLGIRGWVAWQIENESEIQDYVSATPKQRESKKRWADPALRRRLVLAAITHCESAAVLLGFLYENEAALSVGDSYRDTTARAGSLYWQLKSTEVPHWPEPFSWEVPSPFE